METTRTKRIRSLTRQLRLELRDFDGVDDEINPRTFASLGVDAMAIREHQLRGELAASLKADAATFSRYCEAERLACGKRVLETIRDGL